MRALDECISFCASLLSQVLDIGEPGHHGVVGFGAKDPSVTTMKTAALAAFQHELVRCGVRIGVRPKFLVSKGKGHNGGLRVDTVGRLELVKMCSGQDIPLNS